MANYYDDSIWARTGNFLYNNRTWILGILVFIFFICTISLAAKKSNSSCNSETPNPGSPSSGNCKVPLVGLGDCIPENTRDSRTQSECLARGCCWDQEKSKCIFASDHPGYVISLTESNANGLKARLKRNVPSGFKNDIPEVDLTISFLRDDLIRMKFTDAFNQRWEVVLPEPLEIPEPKVSNTLYSVEMNQEGLLKIVRKLSGKVLLETHLSTLIFSDLFHQIEFKTASNVASGFSEHKENEFVKEFKGTKNYPIWNRGEQPSQGIRNLYGTHPFYLMPEDHSKGSSDSHGVFLFNSNAMDIVIHETPSVTWRAVGGVLDFFVFFGPTPLEVTQQYISLIGKPSLPPLWSMGFHIARYGYNTSDTMKEVIKRNRDAKIPYDVQWTDIDALADFHNIFTYDTEKFKDLPAIVKDLHDNNQKYIPMADPSISDTDPNGKVQYDAGKEADIFVKREDNETDLQVKVWNRDTSVLVDFTNPKATDFWHSLAVELDKQTPIDGFWIDMNEPYNMWDQYKTKCTDDIQPEYVPSIENGQLSNRTACLNAKHSIGDHYDVHNLYALYEAKSTYDTLKRMGKRPFVLTRASSYSSGRYTAHWNGDIDSSWDHMRWSITSLLEFNMYGMPMIGADICGFQKFDTSEHLCTRWMELGAFYPFSRNHNDFILAVEQTAKRDTDPGSWPPGPDGKESPVVAGARKALLLRYQLLPYLYTCMAENSRNGLVAVRSLWFNNPTDPVTINVIDQFMWGESVMVVPVIEEVNYDLSKTTRDMYLPAGKWWDIQTKFYYEGPKEIERVNIDLESIMVLIKDGSVIATQEPKLTTKETRAGPFTLYIVFNDQRSAKGSLYWDSGDSIEPLANSAYSFIDFIAQDDTLTMTKQRDTQFKEPMLLDKLVLVNTKGTDYNKVYVNGELSPAGMVEFSPDAKNLMLTISLAKLPTKIDMNEMTITKPLTIKWTKNG